MNFILYYIKIHICNYLYSIIVIYVCKYVLSFCITIHSVCINIDIIVFYKLDNTIQDHTKLLYCVLYIVYWGIGTLYCNVLYFGYVCVFIFIPTHIYIYILILLFLYVSYYFNVFTDSPL